MQKNSQILSLLLMILMSSLGNASTMPLFQGKAYASFSSDEIEYESHDGAFKWGTGVGLSSGKQSSLKFEGVDFSINSFKDSFKIGYLTYNNTKILSGVGAFNAKMKIKLNFDDLDIGEFEIDYDLSIDNTDNRGKDPDDTVTLLPLNHFNTLLTTLDDSRYYFELLGFAIEEEEQQPLSSSKKEDDKNKTHKKKKTSSFKQKEGSDDSVTLYARISTEKITPVNVVSVPTPSILSLLISGLAGFLVFNLRRDK